ncbi:MAG: PAS domain S-box protein [Thermoleophilia bacterium]
MKRWLTLLVIFVIGVAALIGGQSYYNDLKRKESTDMMDRAIALDGEKLSNLIHSQVEIVRHLQAFEQAFGSLPDYEAFDNYVAALVDSNPNIDSLAYIDENRIIRHFYPLAGNENAIGLDLMTRPAAPFVETAIRERRVTLNDPVVNVMGHLAMTARAPLYRGDQFLGMVEGIMDISGLMSSYQKVNDERFNMQLFDTQGKQFWGVEKLAGETATTQIYLEDNSWTLSIGWAADRPEPEGFVIVLIWGVGGAFLLSILFITNHAWTRNKWLNDAVAEKTTELNSTNLQLKDDVARRELVEKHLGDSQVQLDLALRSAKMGVWHFDIVENKRYFDDQVCQILGIDPATFTGAAAEFFSAVHSEDREMLKAALAAAIEHNTPYSLEYRVVWPDGSPHHISARGSVVHDDSGAPVRMNGVVWDVTERRLAEDALAESETKLRAVFEKSRDAIGVSQAGTHIMVNSAFLELFGYQHESDLVGTPILELIAPDDRDSIQKKMQRRTSRAQGGETYETRGLRKNGTEFDMDVSVSTYDLKGIVYTLVILRDTTEHQRLEESLRQSQKMESIGRLAGGVAHDFNNFMTAVEGYIDLSLMDLPQGSPVRDNLTEARRAAERAADLTRQLLLFSRREPLRLKPLSLNATITDLLKMLRRLIGEQYSFVIDLDEKLPAIEADAGLIEQVLMNLAVNARDSMPGGGEIRISTARVDVSEEQVSTHINCHVGEFARIRVTDEGTGMSGEMVSHIFEPFFSTKGAGKGTGLGLSVVFGIVSRHGGWIDVESEPGKGSSFSIYLPALELDAVEAARERMSSENLMGAGEKILLVEDERVVRDLAEKMLSGNGYTVVAVADAETALGLFSGDAADFQLVFSDVILPGMDGVELVGRLRQADPGIKVLLASGFAEGEQHQAIIDQGYTLMQKPYALSELLEQVRLALQMKPRR